MRILQGTTAVDVNDVILDIGGLYHYPYSVCLRENDCKAHGSVVDQYTPFVVLEFIEGLSGKYLRILTTTGEIGLVQYNSRYLKQIEK
jgi:hypothetical protein